MITTKLLDLLWPLKLEYLGKRHEAGDVYTFTLRPERPTIWKAGQYLDYRLGFGLIRHFTIASAPSEKVINITTRIFEKPSKFKEQLLDLKKGQIIRSRNIRGKLCIDSPKHSYLLIAGGIGITPYRAILWDLAAKNLKTRATLIYLNTSTEIPFKKELDAIVKANPSISVYYYTGNEIPDPTFLSSFKAKTSDFFISGPPKMVEHYVRVLRKLDIPYRKIKTDSFLGY
jgi:ferredoxin-NADP reductase